MKKTKHGPLAENQSLFHATAYSSDDIFEIGKNEFDIANFRANPVLLSEHNHDKPVGFVTKMGWQKSGLRVELAFDEESEDGVEAMRKWQKGLSSSLSVGLTGKYIRVQERMSWSLREISQVSVPLDPKATATPGERKPTRVASLDDLSKLEASLKAGDEDEVVIYLTASVASSVERKPAISEDDAVETVTIQNNNKSTTQMGEENTQHLEHLASLVEELKASRDQYKAQVETLTASVKDLKEANENFAGKIETLEASLKKQKDDFANTTEESLLELAKELKDREAKVVTKEASLKDKEGKLAVTEAAVTFKEFLPAGFNAEGLTVLEVLKAAAPKGMPTAELTEEALHGILVAEKTRRLKTRLKASASNDSDTQNTYTAEEKSMTGYISATNLILSKN